MNDIKSWKPGAVLRARLADDHVYYARLLEFPWVAFYDLRTAEPLDDLDAIVGHEPLFTVAAHKSLVGASSPWESIGERPLDGSLQPPAERFIQDDLDPWDIQILDAEDNPRDATPEEAEGLEAAAVWGPEHLADRLVDHYAGRPNPWVESLRLKHP